MVKRLEKSKICGRILVAGGLFLGSVSAFSQNPRLDSLITVANTKVESAYTVPSFTDLKRRLKTAQITPSSGAADTLEYAINNLKASDMPYNIVMNIHQDPKTKMGFNWFTNANVTGGKVEIVQGLATNHSAFATPLKTVNATCNQVNNLNYNVSANNLINEAGFSANNLKKSYTENKALVAGLTPGTVYSFRVGKNGAWSEIGTFTTAKATQTPFTFLYTTDPQANTYEMFDISQKTTHAAFNRFSKFDFWLHSGDLVETSGTTNSEWEWEQLLETQQDLFLKTPFAPINGNHDVSANLNFRKHFNTENFGVTDTTGSTYSYIYGDVQFFALNSELYNNNTYTTALITWMRNEVAAHPEVKWRFVYYHKTVYTGSGSHQSDADGRVWREKIAPVFDELNIDIAFQGHDHIYELMGPINYNGMLTADAVSDINSVPVHPRENVTGKLNGVFNTYNGTLYFLNNSSGKKKYEPRDSAAMEAAISSHGITNYWGLFTGRFGQTGNPTFSNVSVSSDTVVISTYEVLGNGTTALFDEFKVVKFEEPTSINLNTHLLNLFVDSTYTLIANVLPTTASSHVSWESSNSSIAAVTANGVVKGIAEGTALIIATTEIGGLKDTCTVNTKTSVGILEYIENQENTKVYPNPASNVLTIESDQIIKEVMFYTVTGQLVKTVSEPNSDRVIIDTQSLVAGTYSVHIRLENDVQVRRVVIE